ncbi:MAG TPA: hypothetical protein VHG08_08840 [Longimicrobium sp.]|nr:hypothetical protein [Longimicrobium sp.]
MNVESFDKDIERTFEHYGPLGVDVHLLAVRDTPTPTHGDFISVTVAVRVVAPPFEYHAETWNYGGFNSHTSGPLPLGIRFIDRTRLIGAVAAAKELPPGFPLPEASGDLVWPLSPGVNEPVYFFTAGHVTIVVGAYTGTVLGGADQAAAAA